MKDYLRIVLLGLMLSVTLVIAGCKANSGSSSTTNTVVVAPPDADSDGVPDAFDNCVNTANSNQLDTNSDGEGDACDTDDDGDGVPDTADNCPLQSNSGQANTDGDAFGDACDADTDGDGILNDGDGSDANGDNACTNGADTNCDDNCPFLANADQADSNNNGVGDACEGPLGGVDTDSDGIPDAFDNCPMLANTDQRDNDHDGMGDVCDADDDNDGVSDDAPGNDNCPFDPNASQTDTDSDTVGDACDDDTDGDGINNDGDGSDTPGDNTCAAGNTTNCDDNCPFVDNPLQEDANGNGIGDACEGNVGDTDADGVLDDGDGSGSPVDNLCLSGMVSNCDDNCPTVPNGVGEDSQSDMDADGIGDACDPDPDGDSILSDGDGSGDPTDNLCTAGTTVNCDDNCPLIANTDQADLDGDGIGDACDPDQDGDGILDDGDGDGTDGNNPCVSGNTVLCDDNCPRIVNTDQADSVGDGIGDACRLVDTDNDGIPDVNDNCPNVPNPGQEDSDSDGIGDACDNDGSLCQAPAPFRSGLVPIDNDPANGQVATAMDSVDGLCVLCNVTGTGNIITPDVTPLNPLDDDSTSVEIPVGLLGAGTNVNVIDVDVQNGLAGGLPGNFYSSTPMLPRYIAVDVKLGGGLVGANVLQSLCVQTLLDGTPQELLGGCVPGPLGGLALLTDPSALLTALLAANALAIPVEGDPNRVLAQFRTTMPFDEVQVKVFGTVSLGLLANQYNLYAVCVDTSE